jgi:hypothetical protein
MNRLGFAGLICLLGTAIGLGGAAKGQFVSVRFTDRDAYVAVASDEEPCDEEPCAQESVLPEPPQPPEAPTAVLREKIGHARRVLASLPSPNRKSNRGARVIELATAKAEYHKPVVSAPKATPERAIEDLDSRLREAVGDWLSVEEVPLSWQPPKKILGRMFVEGSERIEPIELDTVDETVYRATKLASFSPEARTQLLRAYHREVATQRFTSLAGLLTFVLVSLGLVSGYIRADEATKGYFTWPLRLASIVGFGLAGFVLAHFLIQR